MPLLRLRGGCTPPQLSLPNNLNAVPVAPERSVIGAVAQSVSNLVCSGLRTMRSIATSLSALLGLRTEPPCPYQTFLNSSEVMIFSTTCADPLRLLYQRAIASVQQSLFLRVYRIASPTVVASLKEKVQEKKFVTLHYQILDCELNLPPSPNLEIIRHLDKNKLMHQKALVVDNEYVLFGTANCSDSSLVEDENVVLAIKSEKLSECIIQEKSASFRIGSQSADFYILPQDKLTVYNTILKRLRKAKTSIRVAMLALTHIVIIKELQRAQQRGVEVEVFIDSDFQYECLNHHRALSCRFPVYRNLTSNKLHAKMCVIDDKTLLIGSVNWTKRGLNANSECMLVLSDLTLTQREKLDELWSNLKDMCDPLGKKWFKKGTNT